MSQHGNDLFKVCIRCFTYNQASYIINAMNSFCIQETNFPFVCIIVDDCSTDGEQTIIAKYVEDNFDLDDSSVVRKEETNDYYLTFARHQTNHNCYFAVIFLKYNHYSIKKKKNLYYSEWVKDSKYVALCEGDDYWTDKRKLQRQYDFLESHPDHSLCFHAHLNEYADGMKKEIHRYNRDVEICPMKDIIMGGGGYMATASMFYRQESVLNYPEWTKKRVVGDAALTLVLATRGQVGYINLVMSSYRIASVGSWTNRIGADKELKKKLYKKTLIFWDAFDEGTQRQWHSIIRKKKLKMEYHYFIKRNRYLKKLIDYIKRIK